MIERAILQELCVASDGSLTHRLALRPESVRAVAARMASWRDAPERCLRCQSHRAMSLQGGQPLCVSCREEVRWATDVSSVVREVEPESRMDDPEGTLTGYAIVFDKRSLDLGGFREIIKPSAVQRTIREGGDVRALWNHESGLIFGRVSAGTLAIRADRNGLRVHVWPPKWAAGHAESVERRDVTGQSFGFTVLFDDWHLEDGEPIREVTDMRFSEVSATPFPAYPDTTLTVSPSTSQRIEQLQKWHKNRLAR